jgi:helicase required for RNAi-mediated heterochromatin assembly 1
LRLRFSTRRAGKNIAWTYSDRLRPGSLIALSPVSNGISSKCVVAIVASRLLDNVTKDPPEVDIYLASYNDIDLDPQKEWIMVEARMGYYEANRHTMTALQKLNTER